jgi:hypothetical protein
VTAASRSSPLLLDAQWTRWGPSQVVLRGFDLGDSTLQSQIVITSSLHSQFTACAATSTRREVVKLSLQDTGNRAIARF